MFESPQILQMAHAFARHAAARQGVVATNIAHADTPGYRAQDLIPFRQYLEERPPADAGLRATRAGHLSGPAGAGDPRLVTLTAPGADNPNGNTVSLEQEMVRAARIRQQHDLALGIYRTASTILRRSLGR